MILEILLNKRCLRCFKYGKYICLDCFFKYIGRNEYLRCHVCNKESRIGFVHKECLEYTYLDGVISLSSYTPLLRDLIFRVKYQYIYQIFNDLGDILSEYLKSYSIFKGVNSSNIVVTSVPLSKRKYKVRGFNQSEVLAKRVSKNLDIKYINLLIRTKETKALFSQDKYSRHESIHNAFEILQKKIDWGCIVIVDDIYTSGATLNECAKVLKQRYKVSVYGVVLAKA